MENAISGFFNASWNLVVTFCRKIGWCVKGTSSSSWGEFQIVRIIHDRHADHGE